MLLVCIKAATQASAGMSLQSSFSRAENATKLINPNQDILKKVAYCRFKQHFLQWSAH